MSTTLTAPEIERLLGETVLTMREAADYLGVSTQSTWRWVSQGRAAGDGSVVKLEGFFGARGLSTTKEALARFFARLTAGKLGLPPAPTATEAQRQRRAARATREFERMRREDRRRE